MTYVSVFVSSPDTHSERRFDSDLTIGQLKDKLFPITGILQQFQVLSLYQSSESQQPLAALSNDDQSLAAYGVQEFNCIKVESTDPNARPGEFSDLSAVDKFELSQEEYEKRSDTVLAHLKANKLGRFADTPTPIAFKPPPAETVSDEYKVGARCEVRSDDNMPRIGTVKFVGKTEFGNKAGVWIGVELDEPTGKGDGSVDGHRYFTCTPKHAVFVRPEKVTVGDFPEEDLMASDDEI